MRSKLIKPFRILVYSFIVGVMIINLLKFVIYRYGIIDIETRKFNMIISGTESINPEIELLHALEWYGNWDKLFLTDNFKRKFGNRKNIMNIDNLENHSAFLETSYIDGEILIGICGDVKKNIFEILDPNFTNVSRDYYFRYKVDDNGYLDDVELVGQQDFDAETGFPIGIDDSKYHTIS